MPRAKRSQRAIEEGEISGGERKKARKGERERKVEVENEDSYHSSNEIKKSNMVKEKKNEEEAVQLSSELHGQKKRDVLDMEVAGSTWYENMKEKSVCILWQ